MDEVGGKLLIALLVMGLFVGVVVFITSAPKQPSQALKRNLGVQGGEMLGIPQPLPTDK